MADKPHTNDAECWCKPRVTKVGGSGQTIEHRRTAK